MSSVLFISHSVDDGIFKVGSHHLVRELAVAGHDVAHISTPYSKLHAWLSKPQPRREAAMRQGMRTDEFGVRHLVPGTLLPAQYSNAAYLDRALLAVGMSRPDFLFVDQPLMLKARLLTRARVSIYRPTDMYLDGVAGRLQAKFVTRFDGVAATSTAVLDRLPASARQLRTVIPNGVEFKRFHSDAVTGRRGVVYVGALDYRFDWHALLALAVAHPDLPFALVGPIDQVPVTLPANVELVGPMDYNRVPAYLAKFAVGVLPLSNAPVNAGRSPMKLFEYLAAGLYVVATHQDGFAARSDLRGCFFYRDHEQAATALANARAASVPNEQGVSAARAQDWSMKAAELMAFAQALRQ